MCKLLETVVTEGTAKNARVSGFAIGGKTGTSEKIDVFDGNGQRVQDKIVSFVGVAPMDNPRYIVLVALDTPSRKTGIYISGGVMAAPTVGAVMADILPYLGVNTSYAESDPAGKQIALPDFTQLTAAQTQQLLKQYGLAGKSIGDGETVTTQIPQPGTVVAGDSEVLLYFGDPPQIPITRVPDFTGMNRQQASDTAGKAGLSILACGNQSVHPQVVVTAQSERKDTEVPVGSVIELEFTDIQASD
jgi:stage V sporulation protein D (sporulation-specific penicillin-binding protein)